MKTIAEVVSREREPAHASDQLAALASVESWDDVTVVVVRFDGPGLR